MQTVGQLNENHADILRHREENLFEILSLQGNILVIDYQIVDFRQSVNNISHHVAEKLAHVVKRVVGVLHHIVQQSANHGDSTEVHLGATDHRHRNRVVDVGFSALAPHPEVGVGGQYESLADLFALLHRRARIDHLQQLAVLPHHRLVL